jgi:hypothetical protein
MNRLTASHLVYLFAVSFTCLASASTQNAAIAQIERKSPSVTVTLTLPSAKRPMTVTVESQFAVGSKSATFTETAN